MDSISIASEVVELMRYDPFFDMDENNIKCITSATFTHFFTEHRTFKSKIIRFDTMKPSIAEMSVLDHLQHRHLSQ